MAVTNPKVQATLQRIQEEAKRKVAERLEAQRKLGLSSHRPNEAPQTPKVETPQVEPPQTPKVEEVVNNIKEGIGAVAQALSTKAAQRYIGDLTETLQQAAAQIVQQQHFGGNAADNKGEVIIYPPNCKLLVHGDDGHGSLIIEEPSQFRTLLAQYGKTYRVPMPYVEFMVGFQKHGRGYEIQGMGVGFRTEPLKSIKDHLGMPRLPHCQGNRHICQPLPYRTFETIYELAEHTLGVFWQSEFVYSFEKWNHAFRLKDGRQIKNFKDWQRLGEGNPLDILKGEFGRGDTAQDVLSALGNTEGQGRNTRGYQAQAVVNRVIGEINNGVSTDQLSQVIRAAAEEIVTQAIQNSVGSALQPK